DDEAFQTFKAIRWAENGGEPVCPKCGSFAVYTYAARRIFKCKGCASQFSVTSGTIFANRKLAIRDYLAAIAIFVNGAKGISALQLSRDLNVQYKTAFVLAHKLREAMAAEQQGATVGGADVIVEVDGSFYGGTIRQENKVVERIDRRLKRHQSGLRRAVVVMRERGGRALPFVFKSEGDALDTIVSRVKPGSTVHVDEASVWDVLHARFDMRRINHSVAFSDDGACTNQAESFFSRIRRSELGVHHHFSPLYLHQYAGEMAWREDHRRTSNGDQFKAVAKAAAAHPVSRQWAGYWQR
ncbi:MAG: IS1595 family transposase, partial [Caulobacterales bacterium]